MWGWIVRSWGGDGVPADDPAGNVSGSPAGTPSPPPTQVFAKIVSKDSLLL